MVTPLLGTLAGMASSVVAYWGRAVERADAEECCDGEGSYSAVTPCRRRIARCRHRSHRIPSAASRPTRWRQAGAARLFRQTRRPRTFEPVLEAVFRQMPPPPLPMIGSA